MKEYKIQKNNSTKPDYNKLHLNTERIIKITKEIAQQKQELSKQKSK